MLKCWDDLCIILVFQPKCIRYCTATSTAEIVWSRKYQQPCCSLNFFWPFKALPLKCANHSFSPKAVNLQQACATIQLCTRFIKQWQYRRNTALLSIRILSHTVVWQEFLYPGPVHTTCENSRLSAQSYLTSCGMTRITINSPLWNKGQHFAAITYWLVHLAYGTARKTTARTLFPNDPFWWRCGC